MFPSQSAVGPSVDENCVGSDFVEIEMTRSRRLNRSTPTGSLNAEHEDFIEEEDEDEDDDSTQFISSVPDEGGDDDKPLVDVDVVIHPRDR